MNQVGYNYQTPQPAADVAPLPRDLNILCDSLERLECAVNMLATRLEPVSRASPPTSQSETKALASISNRSSVGSTLENCAARLEHLLQTVQITDGRLEL